MRISARLHRPIADVMLMRQYADLRSAASRRHQSALLRPNDDPHHPAAAAMRAPMQHQLALTANSEALAVPMPRAVRKVGVERVARRAGLQRAPAFEHRHRPDGGRVGQKSVRPKIDQKLGT